MNNVVDIRKFVPHSFGVTSGDALELGDIIQEHVERLREEIAQIRDECQRAVVNRIAKHFAAMQRDVVAWNSKSHGPTTDIEPREFFHGLIKWGETAVDDLKTIADNIRKATR